LHEELFIFATHLGKAAADSHVISMRTLRLIPILMLMLAAPAVASATHARDPNLDPLLDRLKAAPTETEAKSIEQAVWQAWMHSGDVEADSLMLLGVSAMQVGNLPAALAVFDRLVDHAPDFAEAWNKRATVHYLLGDYERSVADIERTLALEPRHFGALSGLGMIYDALGKEEAALKAFQAVLRIHPQLRGIRSHVESLREKLAGRAI